MLVTLRFRGLSLCFTMFGRSIYVFLISGRPVVENMSFEYVTLFLKFSFFGTNFWYPPSPPPPPPHPPRFHSSTPASPPLASPGRRSGAPRPQEWSLDVPPMLAEARALSTRMLYP